MNDSQTHPKIAIYMSAYNHEAYIAEAMESIIGQTYPHWELFVADDGSSDRTAEIIASYKDDRIHFYPLKENTRFAGAIEMIYDIIRPLDFQYMQSMASDDVLDRTKFEKQIGFFRAHPQYAACFTWDKVIFSDGAYGYPEDYSHIRNRSHYSWMNRFYSYGNCMSANSAMVRKDVFFEMDTMNQRYIGISDFRLWAMIAAKYPIYLLQEELVSYRRHANNLSNITLQSAMCFYEESARLLTDMLGGMDERTFRRAYYPHLPFKKANGEGESFADRVVMLSNGNTPGREQAAINLYFDHCSDRTFTYSLKKKYGYDNTAFSRLKESAGLPYAINEIAKNMGEEPRIEQASAHGYEAWNVLLRYITEKRIGTENIGDLTYAPLWQLSNMAEAGEQASSQFQNVKMMLYKLRNLRRERMATRKVLFVVAADSSWVLNRKNTPVAPADGVKYFMTMVNPEDVAYAQDLYEAGARQKKSFTDITEVLFVDLFDEESQCLFFADEVIEGLTDVCYVDCLNRDYECFEMLLGYSLAVSQCAIMDRASYDQMMRDEADMLRLLDGVYCY